MKNRKEELSIYIHIPFCVRKCNYCDFLSFSSTEEKRASYVDALLLEIDRMTPVYRVKQEVVTIYFGGGTPSLLSPEQIKRVLEKLSSEYVLSDDCEITLEVNPGTATKETLCGYREAGVNRLSIGLQSAKNTELQRLGRIHTFEEFLDTYQSARKTGYRNINIDLMSAIPGQNLESYMESVERIIELQPEHISSYSLIVEPGTPFASDMHLEEELPDEETEREMYEWTNIRLIEAGYHRYEISNYSKTGFESRHNCGYWTGRDYLGFGLGASSYYRGERWKNEENLEYYLSHWLKEKTGDVRVEKNLLTVMEQMEEFMFLGLRMMQGISTVQFQETFHVAFSQVYGDVTEKLVQQKLLEQEGEYVRLTARGIDVSNRVLCEFLIKNT